MKQLSGLDSSFLNMETPTQQGHVAGVVILDPATAPAGWGLDTIRDLIADRLHLLPTFRRRLVTVPFDLDQPYWIEDPNFDLDFHLRHIAVPAPGDPEQLADLVARIHARPLDRSRPLWELYLIEGLADGRVATFTKIHHAAIDGISGVEILTTLLDVAPEPRDVEPEGDWQPDRIPSGVELLARTGMTALLKPGKAMRIGYQALRALPGLKPLARLPAFLHHSDDILTRPSLIAPRSQLNREITPHRRFAYGNVDLTTVKAIKNAHDVTVNDVVIAVAAGAVRRWLIAHDDLPDRSLQAMIPISIRSEAEQGSIGNHVSAVIAPIGTHLADPVERLAFVHDVMQGAKEQHQAIPATLLQDFAEFAPPAVAARAARVAFRNGRAGRISPFNLVISNVPGPGFPLYLAGAKLLGHYPVSAIAEGAALNITLHRYLDDLCFGLVADRVLVPELWAMLADIQDEAAELARTS